jgi:predicted TIM-barrel fold metal-dependent hydrolase
VLVRIIDMDTHFAPRDEFAYVAPAYKSFAPLWVSDDQGRYLATVTPGRPAPARRVGQFVPKPRPLGDYDVDTRLRDMDALGVERQMLCPEFSSFCWEMEPRAATAICASSNQAVGKVLKQHPDRFVASAVLPMQDIHATLEEAERALDLGFQAFFMKSANGGKNFDDTYFWPFYDLCNRHNVPICVHSTMQDLGVAVHSQRLQDHWSFPVGSMVDYFFAICSVVYSGVFDVYAKLRFAFAEVGATWIPWLWDRMSITYDIEQGSRRKTKQHPTEYLKSNIYATVDPTEKALGYVCESFSSKNLLLGTDYPHGGVPGRGARLDVIKATHLDLLAEREDLSQEAKEDIFYRNALEFLGGRIS